MAPFLDPAYQANTAAFYWREQQNKDRLYSLLQNDMPVASIACLAAIDETLNRLNPAHQGYCMCVILCMLAVSSCLNREGRERAEGP